MSWDSTASPELDSLPRARRTDAVLGAIDNARQRRAVVARYAPPAIIGVAALTLIWSRLIVINQSVWGDEAFSIFRYIDVGPSAIWDPGQWLPNNHMLFEVLEWATTSVLRTHIEATYRLWSVFPAIAAAVLMTWWLWRRCDDVTAAVFAVLVTVAPLFYDLGTQARGYGLGFLAGVMIVIAADRVIRWGTRASLVLFSLGGLVGMLTLQNFIAPYLAAAAVVMLVGARRRQVVISVACVGVLTLIWYSPLLSLILGYENPYGKKLPWDGFIVAPLRDLFGQGIHSLAPGVSVTAGAILAAVLLCAGAFALWRRGERLLLGLFVAPVLATYLLIEAAAKYTPRFASFAFLPLIGLAAIGLAAAGQWLATVRPLAPVMVVAFVVGSVLALGSFVQFAAGETVIPFEAARSAGQIVNGLEGTEGRLPIFSNFGLSAFNLYVEPRRIVSPGAAQLMQAFCHYPGKFIYLDQGLNPPHPDTSCLVARGAFKIALPERRSTTAVWLVPTLRAAAPATP
jgi:hypothetical protein